jgi:cytochrome b561
MCHCTPCSARLAAKLLSANCYRMADAGTCRVTSPTYRYSATVHQNQGCQFCICLIYRWLVKVLRRETSACHGTTVRSMQPAALSLTATLLPRTRNRWPWLRAKVGHLCLLLLNKTLVAQGDSHQGHFVALTLQILTLFHAKNRVDKDCQTQGVIMRSLRKPCNATQYKHWLMCVACLPYLQANSPSRFVSCLPFKLEFNLRCEAPAIRCLQEKPSALLLALVWRKTAAGSRSLKLSPSTAVPCQSQKHRFLLQQHPPQLAHLPSPGSSPSRRESLRSLRSPTELQHRALTGRRSTISE